ncbi:SpoIIE family protein phosphatase [Nonomuraea sp. MCN248]|uniref:SpoIIE family protein phosphatase n=1 Tax=Nonomuraea corallina TaxID=2989783 RepID=A0ABT4SCS6_9ACTN|nr:SpoIIE family protein phosphatase [Nonomuraea corallina]MDA0635017.1 SpoIIE family protein phosphatase [Nonomuraea corallina]
MGRDEDYAAGAPALEVLDPAPVGVAVTLGPDHRLIYANRAYRSLFGDVPLGVPIREAFGDAVNRESFHLFDQVRETGEPVVVVESPAGPLTTPDGQQRFFTFSLSRATFPHVEHGVVVICLDVTEEVTTARRIQALAGDRSRALRRYASLVRVSGQLIWVNSVDGDLVEPIPEWEGLTGQTWEESRGDGWLAPIHPDDRQELEESWARARREVPAVWEHVYRLRTVDDGYRHFVSRGVPVMEDARVVEWVGTCTDIEDWWQRQRRRELLTRAAQAMGSRESLEETMTALAELIVPDLADGCGVHLVSDLVQGPVGEPSLVIQRVASATGPALPCMPPIDAERLPSQGAFVEAIRRAQPVLRTFPQGSPPEDIGPPGTLAWLRTCDANGLAILPVTIDGTVTAVVTAATCGERPPIGRSDVDLLLETFEQAQDVLRNVMVLQRARRFAVAVQHSLLAEPPHVPGLELAVRYRPSPSADEVGGDWYDAFVLPDGAVVLVIGDVAGHDLRAAVAMGRLRNMLRGLAVDRREPPGEILDRLNKATRTLYGDDTATCVLARVERHGDGHELHYAVAGHPPPLLVTKDARCRFLDSAASPLLGLPYPGPYVSAREPLPPRSTLLLYTDGLVERRGEDFGDGQARLCGNAAAQARVSLDEFCDHLLGGMPLSEADDVALIALRLPGG